MTRSGCNLSFLYGAQESLGRRLSWFGASKMTPSGPSGSRVVQLQHKTCLLCVIFDPRLSSDTTTIPQGFDVALLWVRRGHAALASVFWRAHLPNAGQLACFCVLVTVASSRISMVNFYPRPRHTHEGDRDLNPQIILLSSIFCLQI